MKILYAIQGTGNGHLSRAADIIPALQKRGQVDVLVSGSQSNLSLPHPPKYTLKGIGFAFGKNGGIDFWKTIKLNHKLSFIKEIRNLPVESYDLIVNDFEPISAWAGKIKKIPVFSLSHQSSLLSKKVPQPHLKDKLGAFILKHYAPSLHTVGFHFKSYENWIFTPVIRKKIREVNRYKGKHITVYLPAYGDQKLIKILKKFPTIQWELFSKHTIENYKKKNVHVRQINEAHFIESIGSARGVICGAGFETPAEALFLRKSLLVIPMKGQLEQSYNASALEELGVAVMPAFKRKHIYLLRKWLISDTQIRVDYPDTTQKVVDYLLEQYIELVSTEEDESNEFGNETIPSLATS